MTTGNVDALPAASWLPHFAKAGVLAEALADTTSARGKTIKIGLFLTPNVDRTVPIQVGGRSGRATLRVRAGTRAKEKGYYFEVVWDGPGPTEKPAAGTAKSAAPKAGKGRPEAPPTEAAPVATPTVKTPNSGNDEVWE